MKVCPTCGSSAEEQASFCPCCGTSFVVQPIIPPAPTPKAVAPQPAAVPPPPPVEEKKRGGHALPIAIIAVLAALTVTLATLWLSGGLAAMLGIDSEPADKATGPSTQSNTLLDALPTVAATYGDGQAVTTQQYLAYLYLNFADIYYNQGLDQLAALDPWSQTFPYGEDGEQLQLSDYIIRSTQDSIKRQIVLQQMMQDYGIQWSPEDEAVVEQELAATNADIGLKLGFNNENYAVALKNYILNGPATFTGLYGAGGPRAVSELDLRQYFVQNYLSYMAIGIPLLDDKQQTLDKNSEAYEQIMAKMSHYLTIYEQDGFDAVYVLHTGQPATNARMDVDATQIDEEWAQAVRTVNVGEAAMMELDSNGVPYMVLIQRLNIYDPPELFEKSVEDILYTLKGETFHQEVQAAMDQLSITFDETVITRLQPEDFLSILKNE